MGGKAVRSKLLIFLSVFLPVLQQNFSFKTALAGEIQKTDRTWPFCNLILHTAGSALSKLFHSLSMAHLRGIHI